MVKCVAVEKTGTRTVVDTVPVTKTIDVQVTSYQTQQKTGSRTVNVCTPVTEMQTVTEHVSVPHTETVTVPVSAASSYAPACSEAEAPACEADKKKCGLFKGLFSRKNKGC